VNDQIVVNVTIPIFLSGCMDNSIPGEVLAASKVSAIKADAGPSQAPSPMPVTAAPVITPDAGEFTGSTEI
jgi:hypothetical protein